MQVIGKRLAVARDFSVNVSGANLAYSYLQNLNFANVRFDGALLCRVWFNSSKFTEASFIGSNLQWSFLTDASGITAAQLAQVASSDGMHPPN